MVQLVWSISISPAGCRIVFLPQWCSFCGVYLSHLLGVGLFSSLSGAAFVGYMYLSHLLGVGLFSSLSGAAFEEYMYLSHRLGVGLFSFLSGAAFVEHMYLTCWV